MMSLVLGSAKCRVPSRRGPDEYPDEQKAPALEPPPPPVSAVAEAVVGLRLTCPKFPHFHAWLPPESVGNVVYVIPAASQPTHVYAVCMQSLDGALI